MNLIKEKSIILLYIIIMLIENSNECEVAGPRIIKKKKV